MIARPASVLPLAMLVACVAIDDPGERGEAVDGGHDATVDAADAGAPDLGPAPDLGDPCALPATAPPPDLAATATCHGFATPAPNTTGGACTDVGGTCSDGSACSNSSGSGAMGECYATCSGPPGTSTSDCPVGFRCYNSGPGGLCFQSCDPGHPCASGPCPPTGSCG